MPLVDIYGRGGLVITEALRHEWYLQGHQLTGRTDHTLDFEISGKSLVGKGPDYAKIVNEGLQPSQINPKMYGGLVRYFKLRGLPDNEAMKAAHYTMLKWQKEGMSTEASSRFSKTGQRQHFIETVINDPKIEAFFSTSFDQDIEKKYRETKNETI